jgi:hypothetical protein
MLLPPAEASHVAYEDVPWVTTADGNQLRVVQVRVNEGLWITQSIMQPSLKVGRHRHTGPIWGYTTAGSWKYKEYDYVNRAGSVLYEPASSVHTLEVIEPDTVAWFHMYGALAFLDENDAVLGINDGLTALARYYSLCEEQGLPRPNVLTD